MGDSQASTAYNVFIDEGSLRALHDLHGEKRRRK